MTLSPDGKWFWNGDEWIPAPPATEPTDNSAKYNSTNLQKPNKTVYSSSTSNYHSNQQIMSVSYSTYYLYYFFIVAAWTQIIVGSRPRIFMGNFEVAIVLLSSGIIHFVIARSIKKIQAFNDQEVPVSKQIIAGLIAVMGMLYGVFVPWFISDVLLGIVL